MYVGRAKTETIPVIVGALGGHVIFYKKKPEEDFEYKRRNHPGNHVINNIVHLLLRNRVETQFQKKLKEKWEQKQLQGQYLKRGNASEINKKRGRTFGTESNKPEFIEGHNSKK